ncbi:MAG: extracellular solute-binding protein [Actinobacteria bacterium]|nr:extracellular solute-binding protein [Actinomycetota bacterium]
MKTRSIFLFWCVLLLCVILGSSIVLAKTKLSLWAGYPEMVPFYEKVVKDYQESHPDVEVGILASNLVDFEQKLSITIPTDTVADIFACETFFVRKFIEAGFIPSNPPDIDAMLKGGSCSQFDINESTYGDHTFGFPFFRGREIMFWNKKMFAEEGLTSAPKNWDEVIDYSKKLARYDEQGNLTRSGISLRLSGGSTGVADKWWLWMYPTGGTILEKYPDGKYRAGYDNEAGRKTLKLYIDLLYKYHVDDFKIKHDSEAFALGLTAMFIRESYVIGYMEQYAPQVEYDAALLPSDKRAGNLETLINLYVTRACKNPEVAWDFIKFMLQPEYQKSLFEETGWLPARDDVDYSAIYEKTPQLRLFLEVPENLEFYGYDTIAYCDEIWTRLSERLADAYLDKSLLDNPEGIARVIHEAAEETNNILKENELYHEE